MASSGGHLATKTGRGVSRHSPRERRVECTAPGCALSCLSCFSVPVANQDSLFIRISLHISPIIPSLTHSASRSSAAEQNLARQACTIRWDSWLVVESLAVCGSGACGWRWERRRQLRLRKGGGEVGSCLTHTHTCISGRVSTVTTLANHVRSSSLLSRFPAVLAASGEMRVAPDPHPDPDHIPTAAGQRLETPKSPAANLNPRARGAGVHGGDGDSAARLGRGRGARCRTSWEGRPLLRRASLVRPVSRWGAISGVNTDNHFSQTDLACVHGTANLQVRSEVGVFYRKRFSI